MEIPNNLRPESKSVGEIFSKETIQKVENERRSVHIDFLVIFVAIRLVHTFLFYLKYFINILTSQHKFDKNQILWLFPFIGQDATVNEMNQAEFRYFIIGYVNKFEREILLNQKISLTYRTFIDDVIHNFEWRLDEKEQEFQENHVSKKYNFQKDLHYITDIVSKLHLPIPRSKFENGFETAVSLFDSYTESPHLNTKGACDLVLKTMQYIQSEVQAAFIKSVQFFGIPIFE